jgi:hypothetical protein
MKNFRKYRCGFILARVNIIEYSSYSKNCAKYYSQIVIPNPSNKLLM